MKIFAIINLKGMKGIHMKYIIGVWKMYKSAHEISLSVEFCFHTAEPVSFEKRAVKKSRVRNPNMILVYEWIYLHNIIDKIIPRV